MRHFRNTKILAALGPASSDKDTIRTLSDVGAGVFRLNFSHGSYKDHRRRYDTVYAVEAETGRPIGILADIRGLKLRIGTFAGGRVVLENDDRFVLGRGPMPGNVTRVYLSHPELYVATAPGQSLLLDDGKTRLTIEAADLTAIATRMVGGGPLLDRKDVNVPDAVISIPTSIRKDLCDPGFASSLGADWIALSFMQRAEDVIAACEIIGDRAGLLSEIEKPVALPYLGDVVQTSGALVVARDDLDVGLPPERVPGVQKHTLCMMHQHGKPVIAATQMLESMVEVPVPTRAEASDVVSAMYDGTGAMVPSTESVSGEHPVMAVSIMNHTIIETKRDPLYRNLTDVQHQPPLPICQDVICAALCDMTYTLGAVATVTYTPNSRTDLCTACEWPLAPTVSITPRLDTACRLAIMWGVHSTASLDVSSVDEIVDAAC